MDRDSLPTILEVKRTLAGEYKEFRCHVVERDPDRATVLFVSSRAYQVGGLSLPAGTITLGHFWRTRAYNVYHWLTPEGRTLGYYFNLAADTTLADETLRWLDLTVDILVQPGLPPRLLDEEELPADLALDVRAQIEAAKQQALGQRDVVIPELEERADGVWPRLFGKRRS